MLISLCFDRSFKLEVVTLCCTLQSINLKPELLCSPRIVVSTLTLQKCEESLAKLRAASVHTEQAKEVAHNETAELLVPRSYPHAFLTLNPNPNPVALREAHTAALPQ